MPFGDTFRGKRVFVTGHTGFKGSWLCEWLLQLGARVSGYSLPPPTTPALFDKLKLAERIERHEIGDVRSSAHLEQALQAARPEFVLHLAAQSLVRESYRVPLETYATNLTGTIHLLEALRHFDHPCAVVLVTTDKCYENHEEPRPYREDDALGGHDPYSSSKAAMEIAVSSWRRSFFRNHPVRLATARAGNVIGGGDWAADRIVPDCIRALQAKETVAVRHPSAVRPWQHVLEPLGGYLLLATQLAVNDSLASAFNFGPTPESNRCVRDVVTSVLHEWPGTWADASDPRAVHEAGLLQLDISRAREVLRWEPTWTFDQTVAETVRWYRQEAEAPEQAATITQAQIASYTAHAHAGGSAWAAS